MNAPAPTDWWSNFFTGLMVDFWHAVIPEEATLAEADFLESRLAVERGARLLDVPCGDGRLAVELARRGYRLTGIDLSAEFLEKARERAAARGVDVDWRRCDMRDLSWRGELDGAFCAGNSFGYFDDAGNEAFLRAVSTALKPGGRFVLDYGAVAEALFSRFHERLEIPVGDLVFRADNRYEPDTGRLENVITVERGAERESRPTSQRVYAYRELAERFRRAGFEDLRAFGSPAGDPFALGSPRLLLVAARSGEPVRPSGA